MKKLSIILLSSLFISTMLFANGSSEESTTEKANKAPSKVLLWSYMSGEEGKALAKIAEGYNNSQSNYQVEIEYVPFGDMKKKYSMGMVANELPDIGTIDNPDMAAFASMGLFEDITSRVNDWNQSDKYFEGPLKSTMLNNKYYGLPLTSNCLAMFYNKEIFKENNLEVPTTWDELLEIGKKLKTKDMYPLALSAVKTEEGVFQYLPWYLSTGATVENPSSKESIKALTFFETMLDNGIISPEVISWDQSDVYRQFASKKAAMMINGPWNISAVQRDAPDLDFGIALVPKDKQFASVLGGENFGIIKGGNVDGAWDFLKYYSSKEIMDKFISQTGYFPPRKDVAKENVRWTEDPILKIFMQEMQYAAPRGPSAKWPQISAALAEGLQKGLSESYTAEEAMKEAQTKINEALNN
ncbi:MAG: ABC transporter substrate-binding protein [Spirochaetia bacterium]|nr:ABC transporter substrate-binding protein [Spirochaetia bacterium]